MPQTSYISEMNLVVGDHLEIETENSHYVATFQHDGRFRVFRSGEDCKTYGDIPFKGSSKDDQRRDSIPQVCRQAFVIGWRPVFVHEIGNCKIEIKMGRLVSLCKNGVTILS